MTNQEIHLSKDKKINVSLDIKIKRYFYTIVKVSFFKNAIDIGFWVGYFKCKRK